METLGSIAAILMASGFSKRFNGLNKLLVPFRGKPLARYTLELVSALDFSGGIFFIAASENVAAIAADLPVVTVIKNNAPEKGIRESVRLGVEAAGSGAGYYLFFPCDMPFLNADTVKSILDLRRHGRIVEPHFRGVPGNPCLFSGTFRDELLSLKEGETPRLIKERHPGAVIGFDVKNPSVLEDVDDEASYIRILNRQ